MAFAFRRGVGGTKGSRAQAELEGYSCSPECSYHAVISFTTFPSGGGWGGGGVDRLSGWIMPEEIARRTTRWCCDCGLVYSDKFQAN